MIEVDNTTSNSEENYAFIGMFSLIFKGHYGSLLEHIPALIHHWLELMSLHYIF